MGGPDDWLPLSGIQHFCFCRYPGASPALMGKCARLGVDLSFFSPQGRFLARAVGEERGNVLLRQTQYRIADSKAESCLYARNFILGKVYNARWVLERATRDHPQRVPVEQLKRTSARPGRRSLALDLMEELRTVYADRFVLSCINQKILNPKHFQKQENGAVLLTDEGRRAFLGGWQTRKQETITHPFLNEKLPWGLVPYVQALLLARTLRGDMELYPPFFWK